MAERPPRPGGRDKSEGFRCRHCHSRISKVTDTRTFTVTYYGQTKTLVKRRRICFHCKLPFTTIETMEDEANPGNPEIITLPPLPDPSNQSTPAPPIPFAAFHPHSQDNKIQPPPLLPPKKTDAPRRRKKR